MTTVPLTFKTSTTRVFDTVIPLSLYIHFPWCVKKCPYCDFNSHALKTDLPEEAYIQALLMDLEQALPQIWGRPIHSIFMGGGTPSLFSPKSIDYLMTQLRALLKINPAIEVTLEANPGTVEQARFEGYRQAGINRISLGIQSFSKKQLMRLGRIHDDTEALAAIAAVRAAGFDDFNIDLMYSLPEQTIEEALNDLKTAIECAPPHLSWYQLTLEPNTPFYHRPPKIPDHDLCCDIEEAGLAFLAQSGYQRYEISAFTRQKPCHHNVNYWQFGDYLGIGAGAHSKITDIQQGTIFREVRHKHPKDYLNVSKQFMATRSEILLTDRPFEYMLNALRLLQGVPSSDFQARTGLSLIDIAIPLKEAEEHQWLTLAQKTLQTTPLGQRFLNDLTSLFL